MATTAPATRASGRTPAMVRRRASAAAERLVTNVGDGRGDAEEQAEIDRNDGRIARSRNQARDAAVQPDGGSRPEQKRRQCADTERGQQRDGRRSPPADCWTKNKPVDPGIEIAHRPEPLAQFVDVEFFPPVLSRSLRYQLRPATNCESSRSRSARRPNGRAHDRPSRQSSSASWRAPSAPLNDTNVVFLTSSRVGLSGLFGSPRRREGRR